MLCPPEDEPPVSSTLPIRLTSRACWAPHEAARLVVMHRGDNDLVVTTYELGAKKSRDAVNILGEAPVSGPAGPLPPALQGCVKHRCLTSPLGHLSFPQRVQPPAKVSLFAMLLLGGWSSASLGQALP